MPDDRELSDINPYDLMESEAARLEFYLASLTGEAWDEPSACEGWSVKDVLAHLAGGEEYNRACLTDSIGAMFERYTSRGATDLNAFNALGVSDRKDQRPADLLDEWRRENGETRSEMRHRDGEQMPTAVGQYPVRWQAWHLASELATHADDVNVPVTHKREEDARAATGACGSPASRWPRASPTSRCRSSPAARGSGPTETRQRSATTT